MARMLVTFDGTPDSLGAPLLMHNERLSDPLDPYAKWLAELSKKTRKSDLEQEEVARREFLGSGYWQHDEGPGATVHTPVVPTFNIRACLIAAARRHKLGKSVEQEVYPVLMEVPLEYDGPKDGQELWDTRQFHLRKGVALNGRRVPRTRPMFGSWSVTAEFESGLSTEQMQVIAYEAGRLIGLGDYRPTFGRFLGTVQVIDSIESFLIPDEVARAYGELAKETGQKAVAKHSVKQAPTTGNGRVKVTA